MHHVGPMQIGPRCDASDGKYSVDSTSSVGRPRRPAGCVCPSWTSLPMTLFTGVQVDLSRCMRKPAPVYLLHEPHPSSTGGPRLVAGKSTDFTPRRSGPSGSKRRPQIPRRSGCALPRWAATSSRRLIYRSFGVEEGQCGGRVSSSQRSVEVYVP